jgi:SMODS and SLOG-associating 2TM effector domain 1
LTGHRELSEPGLIRQSIEEALDRIDRRVPGAFLSAVSSGATGADTIFAEAVLARDLPWKLLLPFPAKKFFNAHDFPDDALAQARYLAREAEARITVTSNSGSEETRKASFLECSLCTVDECDVLIAVWDGQPGRLGGTESAVAHARQLGRPLIRIDPVTGLLTEERLENLPEAAKSGPTLSVPSRIDEEFQLHTKRAKAARPWAINLIITLVGLHQAATAVAVLGLIWKSQGEQAGDTAAIIKVLALITAVLLPFWVKHKCNQWIDHRMQAEILRSVTCLWPLPNPGKVFEPVRVPAFEKFQTELLHQRLASAPDGSLSVAGFKKNYLRTRMTTQLDYYREHAHQAHTKYHWLEYAASMVTGLAILCGVLIIFHGVGETGWLHDSVKFLSITLPLLTTFLLAIATARDLKRRMIRYADMAFFLQAARREIELAVTWEQLSEAVIRVERRLLFEIWEWCSVARYGAAH